MVRLNTWVALGCSIVFGALWSAVVQRILGEPLARTFAPVPMAAGVVAGWVAGMHTVWSRARRGGDESFLDGVATYYLGIVAYWVAFVIAARVALCVRAGGWTTFDLRDHLISIVWYLGFGTLPWGLALLPLCFLTRALVWRIHESCPESLSD